jgi:hypothetical protein
MTYAQILRQVQGSPVSPFSADSHSADLGISSESRAATMDRVRAVIRVRFRPLIIEQARAVVRAHTAKELYP